MYLSLWLLNGVFVAPVVEANAQAVLFCMGKVCCSG